MEKKGFFFLYFLLALKSQRMHLEYEIIFFYIRLFGFAREKPSHTICHDYTQTHIVIYIPVYYVSTKIYIRIRDMVLNWVFKWFSFCVSIYIVGIRSLYCMYIIYDFVIKYTFYAENFYYTKTILAIYILKLVNSKRRKCLYLAIYLFNQ